jgi:putative ubiquitin-RnfH superfamily antitoxin RatB of RatAB toxin-antitoxin module
MAHAEIRVEVVYCPRPGVVDRTELTLAAGGTLDEALRASGVLARHELSAEAVRKGVWSKVKAGDTALRDGDRVELYRDLTVDPKEARRLRYKRRGERKAPKAA